MSSLVLDKVRPSATTSEAEITDPAPPHAKVCGGAPFILYGTTAGHPRELVGGFDEHFLVGAWVFSAPQPIVYNVVNLFTDHSTNVDRAGGEASSPADSVRRLRDATGLTWDQVARMFGVSRRAVHLWANGGKLSAANEELLVKANEIVAQLPGESADEVRREFLRPQPGGRLSLYDELRSRHASAPSDISRSPATGF